jgi:hypothetical protein
MIFSDEIIVNTYIISPALYREYLEDFMASLCTFVEGIFLTTFLIPYPSLPAE